MMIEATMFPIANPPAELPVDDGRPGSASLGMQALTLVVIILPLLAVLALPFFVWGWGFSWVDLGLLLGMYVLTTLGITVGFHRLFVHRSFDTFTWVKVIFVALGSMAVQGTLLKWVGLHRRHHQYSDTPQDPHSPNHHGDGLGGVMTGFWHAHIGWFFDETPDTIRYTRDLSSRPALRVASALFPLWLVLGLVLPAALGGIITQTWLGFWTGLIWGGLVRLFIVHHLTWSINSACHLWGVRPYESQDQSRNNLVFGFVGMGEGWHNSHHAFPSSARHGLRWWELDLSYHVIQLLQVCGLAWNVRVPTKEARSRALARAVPA